MLQRKTELATSPGILVTQSGLGTKSGALNANPDPRIHQRKFVLVALGDRVGDVLDQADNRRRSFRFTGQPAVRLAEFMCDKGGLANIKRRGGHLSS